MRTLAVLIGLEYSYMRDALRGIAAFLADKSGWQLDAAPVRVSSIRRLSEIRPDGVITHGLPQHWLGRPEWHDWPWCTLFEAEPVTDRAMNATSDNIALGRLAAEHLAECGFEHFGFVSPGYEWNRLRLQGMCETLGKTPEALSVFEGAEETNESSAWWYGAKWPEETASWLQEQPRSLGLVAGSPAFAYGLCRICHTLGLRVPEDVAIISIGDDNVLCRIAHPAVSSALIPWEAIGYEAARQLVRRIEGETDVPRQIVVPPVGVVPRGSTDISATTDETILTAERYIRDHCGSASLNVEKVAKHVGTPRRSLERHFRREIGRSVLQEIRRVRVNRIKQLLAETDLSIEVIAKRTGVRHTCYLATMFRQLVGQPPTKFREQFRPITSPSA